MKLDNIEFSSKSEYMAALRDKNRIESIKSRVNLDDPKAAGELYRRLKSQPAFFESELGRQFVKKLSRMASPTAAGVGSGALHTDHSAELELEEQRRLNTEKTKETGAEGGKKKTVGRSEAAKPGNGSKFRNSGYNDNSHNTENIGKVGSSRNPGNTGNAAKPKSAISIVSGPESLKQLYNRDENAQEISKSGFSLGKLLHGNTDKNRPEDTKALERKQALDELISDERELNEFWDEHESPEISAKTRAQRKKITKIAVAAVGLIATIILISCFSKEIGVRIEDYKSNRKMQELQKAVLKLSDSGNRRVHNNTIHVNAAENEGNGEHIGEDRVPTGQATGTGSANNTIILPEFKDLYKRNTDMVGWIQIPGTIVNYPVMQTKSDMEYYLKRDFDREENRNGLPFADARSNVFNASTNIIIYGHCMNNGTMFATLLNYKDESYYKKHPIIYFDTIYERAEYEIVAVFQSRIMYSGEETFRYYNFIEAENEADFNDFVTNIKAMSYYNTGITANYGDTFITLSTCDKEIKDGRMVIVARKIK